MAMDTTDVKGWERLLCRAARHCRKFRGGELSSQEALAYKDGDGVLWSARWGVAWKK